MLYITNLEDKEHFRDGLDSNVLFQLILYDLIKEYWKIVDNKKEMLQIEYLIRRFDQLLMDSPKCENFSFQRSKKDVAHLLTKYDATFRRSV